jgi:preprotein translocase subunit SecA
MLGFLSKIFGGSKSEKDVQKILPLVDQINSHFNSYGSLSNDELRQKTLEFRSRIKDWLSGIDGEIAQLNTKADETDFQDIVAKDEIYQQVDQLKKDRDKKIEEVLKEILPEAFAVMKETARRFK